MFHLPNGRMGFGMGIGPRHFEQRYRVYSVAMLSIYSNSKITEIEHGGKVILPPSALSTLSQMEVQWPVMFEIEFPETGK
ncbi:hypothetical protein SARC_11999, partial [Sphaeroforma arctica JP610]